jgi:tetratricopeptide (TPR) repeat protein
MASTTISHKPVSKTQLSRSPTAPGDGIIHSLDYNPKIDFQDTTSKGLGVTAFSQNATHICIYIDEAWPGMQSKEYENVGVISGIVWNGLSPDENVLPQIQTHLRCRSEKQFHKAILRLLQCRKAFPFVCPVIQPKVTQNDYPDLLRIALATLLCWILPQNGCDCDVQIFCEGIQTAQMQPGKNYASRLTEVLQTIHLLTGRKIRWKISKFVSLSHADKNFQYVPYADAVGYLTTPSKKANMWGKSFDVKKWPGYVPIDQALLKRLHCLDSASPAGYADELFDFTRIYQKTKIFYYILEQAVQKAKKQPTFCNALLEKLEEMFEQKGRDPYLLAFLCDSLVRPFPVKYFNRHPHQKLLRLLIEIQNANHNGKPALAKKCLDCYIQLRDNLRPDNRELCAYTDMNLAVHYNDSFDFAEASSICRPWENDPAFVYLTIRIRGIILSSIGQSYAIAGDVLKAHEYFIRALKLFNPDPNLMDETDQTAVYCAHNLLDCPQKTMALKTAQTVLQCNIEEAINRYGSTLLEPYHHHLLVKNLYLNPEAEKYRDAYLAQRQHWQSEPQHPWELIELYRVLMLYRVYPAEANERAARLWALFQQVNGGSTIQLIEAFARCAVARVCGFPCLDGLGAKLDAIQHDLPPAAPRCDALRRAATGELSDAEFWSILPFNYK